MHKEIELLLKQYAEEGDEAIIKDFIPEIEALVAKFDASGQSGGSAPYTAQCLANTVRKLCLHQPLTPLTGDYLEWNDVTEFCAKEGEKVFQNNRNSAVFLYERVNGAFDYSYLDAIVWREGDCSWHGTAKVLDEDGNLLRKVNSSQCFKSFPFTPKTFHVDVINDEEGDFVVSNKEQLQEALDYYAN